MGNMAILRIGGGLAALLMMGGCMSVESCDPSQVNNVVSSAMCQGGGYYDQRQANMGANLNTMTAAVEPGALLMRLPAPLRPGDDPVPAPTDVAREPAVP